MNHEAIETQLAELPHQIREAQKAHVEAKDLMEKAKLKLKIAHSTALVTTKAPNATEKAAYASIKTEKEAIELIEAQTEEARKETELEYLKNRFIALRKIVSLETELIRTNLSGN